mgnify:CR=1 FL=1
MDVRKLTEDKKFALLYGILLGDGCLSYSFSQNKPHYFIVVTGNLYSDKPFFEKIVLPVFTYFRKKQIAVKERKRYEALEINFCDKYLFNKIHHAGFRIGIKGPNITLPKKLNNKKLLKHIVQGFFATDGCLSITKNNNYFYPRIVIKTIHKKLMKTLYKYLLSIGLEGSFLSAKKIEDQVIGSLNNRHIYSSFMDITT